MDQVEGMESFAGRAKGHFESIHDVLQPLLLARRRSNIPITSQIPSAIHSALVKCPGTAGTSFISTSSAETALPRMATARMAGRVSTKKNEMHAANHPKAAAIEPTSVTGTSNESP